MIRDHQDLWTRIDHDQLTDDPPGVVDVPSNVAVGLFIAALPVLLLWLIVAGAWQAVTRWR